MKSTKFREIWYYTNFSKSSKNLIFLRELTLEDFPIEISMATIKGLAAEYRLGFDAPSLKFNESLRRKHYYFGKWSRG